MLALDVPPPPVGDDVTAPTGVDLGNFHQALPWAGARSGADDAETFTTQDVRSGPVGTLRGSPVQPVAAPQRSFRSGSWRLLL